MSVPESYRPVPAVENALTLLRYMAASGTAQGVAALSRATGLNVSSTFNILKTLVHEGFVTFDLQFKTYQIGMGVLEIVGPVLGANPNDLIRPLLEEMAEEHRVLIALWHFTENERIVLIDTVEPQRIVRASMERGSRLPAMIGGVGRCYVARIGMSREECQRRYADLKWQSDPGFDAYWQSVEEARRDGYGFDFGNMFRGIHVAGSLACDRKGKPRLGLSTIAIAGQIDAERLREVAISLRNAARSIERSVFGVPGEAPGA